MTPSIQRLRETFQHRKDFRKVDRDLKLARKHHTSDLQASIEEFTDKRDKAVEELRDADQQPRDGISQVIDALYVACPSAIRSLPTCWQSIVMPIARNAQKRNRQVFPKDLNSPNSKRLFLPTTLVRKTPKWATGLVAMSAILLNLTDPLSPAQHSQLMARLDKEVDDAPCGTQFTMGVVSEDTITWCANNPLCKLQDGRSASSVTLDVCLIDERHRTSFVEALGDNDPEVIKKDELDPNVQLEKLPFGWFLTHEKVRRQRLPPSKIRHA